MQIHKDCKKARGLAKMGGYKPCYMVVTPEVFEQLASDALYLSRGMYQSAMKYANHKNVGEYLGWKVYITKKHNTFPSKFYAINPLIQNSPAILIMNGGAA